MKFLFLYVYHFGNYNIYNIFLDNFKFFSLICSGFLISWPDSPVGTTNCRKDCTKSYQKLDRQKANRCQRKIWKGRESVLCVLRLGWARETDFGKPRELAIEEGFIETYKKSLNI